MHSTYTFKKTLTKKVDNIKSSAYTVSNSNSFIGSRQKSFGSSSKNCLRAAPAPVQKRTPSDGSDSAMLVSNRCLLVQNLGQNISSPRIFSRMLDFLGASWLLYCAV